MFLSVVIPAYNEEERLGSTLSRIRAYLEVKGYDYEIIVVDDGSTDTTVLTAQKTRLAGGAKLKVISNRGNVGKGFSVKRGLLDSKGDYVLLCDADLSTPIEEVDKLFNYISSGYDIVIGSRSVRGSDLKIRQPWYREIMGKVFNRFVKLLFFKEFNDTQCGFKLLKGNIAREIASCLKINGFCFDVELLYIARCKGYKIREVGITWCNSLKSKVKVFNSSINMFYDLLRIKKLHA